MIQNRASVIARYPIASVAILMALCLLPAMIMRDWSPSNELRYLDIVDEAISGGHLFAFTCQGEPYADKPPLYFWCLMLCRIVFGKHVMFAMNLFSFLPALVILHVMDRWLAVKDPEERAAVALMMGTSAMFLGLSVFLRMDMMMCMFIVLALWTFWKMYSGQDAGKRQEVLLPLYVFLALFTKGPVGLLMPVLVIVVFLLLERQGRQIGRYLGWKFWLLMALLCAVWFTGVYLDGGREYLNNLLFHQTMDRAVNSFHHKKPVWYYLAAIWYISIPYSILLAGSIAASLWKTKSGAKSRSTLEIFMLSSIATPFVMLSSFSSKLAVYLMPVLPFMVMLFAVVVGRIGWKKWMTWSLAVVQGVVLFVCAAALCIRVFAFGMQPFASLAAEYPIARNPMLWSSVVVLGAGLAMALHYLLKRKNWKRSVIFTAAGILLMVYTASFSLKELNSYIGYGNLCSAVPEGNAVATIGVHRPENMNVYLGYGITDYHKDFSAFYASEIEGGSSDEALSLIVSDRILKKDEALKAFVLDHPHLRVGPYYVVSAR